MSKANLDNMRALQGQMMGPELVRAREIGGRLHVLTVPRAISFAGARDGDSATTHVGGSAGGGVGGGVGGESDARFITPVRPPVSRASSMPSTAAAAVSEIERAAAKAADEEAAAAQTAEALTAKAAATLARVETDATGGDRAKAGSPTPSHASDVTSSSMASRMSAARRARSHARVGSQAGVMQGRRRSRQYAAPASAQRAEERAPTPGPISFFEEMESQEKIAAAARERLIAQFNTIPERG